MARASIKTAEGIAIELEGSPEEVARVVEDLRRQSAAPAPSKTRRTSPSRQQRIQIPDLIDDLKAEQFFKIPKGLSEVRTKLAEMGHHYPLTTLSRTMQRETRKRALRRFMEKGKYVYVQ